MASTVGPAAAAAAAATLSLRNPGVRWVALGWTGFIAENLILSENRTAIIDAIGDREYHLVYSALSTAACTSIGWCALSWLRRGTRGPGWGGWGGCLLPQGVPARATMHARMLTPPRFRPLPPPPVHGILHTFLFPPMPPSCAASSFAQRTGRSVTGDSLRSGSLGQHPVSQGSLYSRLRSSVLASSYRSSRCRSPLAAQAPRYQLLSRRPPVQARRHPQARLHHPPLRRVGFKYGVPLTLRHRMCRQMGSTG